MKRQPVFLFLTVLAAIALAGCGTKLGRHFEKTYDNTKDGLTDTKTNIEDQLSKSCTDTLKVSEDADEVLRLVSSEDDTVFTVDGKKMGQAKQLKVCINSKAKHTVVAEPPGCVSKTESIAPPYDFPIYEFRYMMAECKKASASKSTKNAPQKTTRKRSSG
jgi:hypothetical protein